MGTRGILTVTSRRSGDYLHVTLRDTGPGLPDYARDTFLKVEIRRPPEVKGKGRGRAP